MYLVIVVQSVPMYFSSKIIVLIFLTIPDLDNCQNVKKAVSLIEAVEEKLVNKQVCSILISGLEGS